MCFFWLSLSMWRYAYVKKTMRYVVHEYISMKSKTSCAKIICTWSRCDACMHTARHVSRAGVAKQVVGRYILHRYVHDICTKMKVDLMAFGVFTPSRFKVPEKGRSSFSVGGARTELQGINSSRSSRRELWLLGSGAQFGFSQISHKVSNWKTRRKSSLSSIRSSEIHTKPDASEGDRCKFWKNLCEKFFFSESVIWDSILWSSLLSVMRAIFSHPLWAACPSLGFWFADSMPRCPRIFLDVVSTLKGSTSSSTTTCQMKVSKPHLDANKNWANPCKQLIAKRQAEDEFGW